jgi:hypothetical protein
MKTKGLPQETLTAFVNADHAGLLVAWDGGVNNEVCEACNRQRGDVVLSILSSKDDLSDPASGEITILGTTCFNKIKKDLGLKVKINET